MIKSVALLIVTTFGLVTPLANAGMVRTVYDAQGNPKVIGAHDPTPPGFTGEGPWPQPPAAAAASAAPQQGVPPLLQAPSNQNQKPNLVETTPYLLQLPSPSQEPNYVELQPTHRPANLVELNPPQVSANTGGPAPTTPPAAKTPPNFFERVADTGKTLWNNITNQSTGFNKALNDGTKLINDQNQQVRASINGKDYDVYQATYSQTNSKGETTTVTRHFVRDPSGNPVPITIDEKNNTMNVGAAERHFAQIEAENKLSTPSTGTQPPGAPQNDAVNALRHEMETREIQKAARDYDGLGKKYNRNSAIGMKKNDPCKMGTGIDGKYECQSTVDQIEMGQLSDALGQVAGSAATQVVGQQQQIKAQGSGSQADAMEGAAITSKTAGMAQGAKGMMNMMFGAMGLKAASDHKKNAEEIANGSDAGNFRIKGDVKTEDIASKGNSDKQVGAVISNGDDNSVSAKIIRNWEMNKHSEHLMDCSTVAPQLQEACKSARETQANTKLESVQNEAGIIGSEAAGEQEAIAKKAKAAGIMSMMKGAADAIQAAGNLMAAKEYQKAADKLRGKEGAGGIGGYAPPTFAFSPSGARGNQGGGNMGGFNTGSDQAAVAGEVLTDPKNDDLGQGFGSPKDDTLAGPGPAPGAFAAGGPQGGGGGGGLSLGGGGSTSSTPQEQEQQAAMAQDSGSLGYSAGVYRGGGGGRSGGGSKDPDISGMMAAMLGKKEDGGTKNSILDYGGSRGPASMNEGLLSSDTDLFQQVSKRYQQKNQVGAVGLN
jgi:hypothetical protein